MERFKLKQKNINKMYVKEQTQKEILEVISKVGATGAMITEIEKQVKFERHTLSKYLSFMQAHGLIYHKFLGRAKLWFINKIPLQTLLHALPEKKTFIEGVLVSILKNIPMSLIVIDENYNILFQDEKALLTYGDLNGQKFYKAILGKENPLKIKDITNLIFDKTDSAEVLTYDLLGNTLRVHASSLLNPDKSKSIILLLNDITEKERIKNEIKKRNAILEAEKLSKFTS
jgi:hypothetical protein